MSRKFEERLSNPFFFFFITSFFFFRPCWRLTQYSLTISHCVFERGFRALKTKRQVHPFSFVFFARTRTNTHIFSLTHKLTHTHTHMYTLFLSLSHFLHTHSNSSCHSLTHTLTHIFTHFYTSFHLYHSCV
jgi:hypothetical protein